MMRCRFRMTTGPCGRPAVRGSDLCPGHYVIALAVQRRRNRERSR